MPPSLIDNLIKFSQILKDNEGNDVMDLSKYTFLAPPTLLPVLQYMELHDINQYIPNPSTRSYLEKVLGREKCTDTTIPLRKLKTFNFTDYFQVADKIELYLSDLTDEIIGLIPLSLDLAGMNILLYELLTNIYKHSKCDNAYILCQWYPNVQLADVCIIDDGISIPGSLEETGEFFDEDAEAIFNAINCTSSDKEDYGLHGRGLNTSAAIASLGFREEMLISSRDGTCIIDEKGITLYKNVPYIQGTFISLRVNTNKIRNIHEYTKKREYAKNE